MAVTLFSSDGGHLVLPDRSSLLVSRENGGNLVVNPPAPVWERSALTPIELTHFAFLVAAAGRAMIDVLPQLAGGCVNYWEAGNWALNDEAEPKGRKQARAHRQMHLHRVSQRELVRRRRMNVLFLLVVTVGISGFLAATTHATAVTWAFALSFVALCGYCYKLAQIRAYELDRQHGDQQWFHAA